jgi:hypothetical protein
MKITRRKLAAVLATSAAAPAIISAQPAASDEETQSAHDSLRNNAEALKKIKIPIATEPPFHFKA